MQPCASGDAEPNDADQEYRARVFHHALMITWQRDPEGLFYQAIKLAHAGDLDREVEILAPRCHDRRVARCRSAAHGRRPGRR